MIGSANYGHGNSVRLRLMASEIKSLQWKMGPKLNPAKHN
jgi:hypothetical protein